MEKEIKYAKLAIGEADGRCRWCGDVMELIKNVDNEIIWEHSTPITDERCDEFLGKKQ